MPLWAPVALGAGIVCWFVLSGPMTWLAAISFLMAAILLSLCLPAGTRMRQVVQAACLLMSCGCLLVWGKALWVGQVPLQRPVFAEISGIVQVVRPVPARKVQRVTLRVAGGADVPGPVRVNISDADMPAGLGEGAAIRFRVRLMPPALPDVPGGYDFARRAYFDGIAATGRALPPIIVERPSDAAPPLRRRLFDHVLSRVDGTGAGVAAALATGDQGGIADADAEAMRRSGLAHLLSISGLHVTALIGAVIFLLMRLLALSRRVALHLPIVFIAAGGGAVAGIGYTLLTGAEVPTVRSCVAALLVLAGLAMGRDAMTLRLVAAGAIFVLALWPEVVIGPSFQMSFAAVVAIIALSEDKRFNRFARARDESSPHKIIRMMTVALMTGIAVELALMPIALFHFHKAGLMGAIANLVAIPLTTFVVMPFEALALLLDVGGVGAPAWWVVGRALDALLIVAHTVSASPYASMMAPIAAPFLFAATMLGLLWLMLWRTAVRWLGLPVAIVGGAAMFLAPSPDILVTTDGRHVAFRSGENMAILRGRAGDYVRDALGEGAGYAGDMIAIDQLPAARCSADLCAATIQTSERTWRLLMTRSNMMVDRPAFARDCAAADIVISDRGLPRWCQPRWLKIDRPLLRQTGGIAIYLENAYIRTVSQAGDAHPWMVRPQSMHQLYRRKSPASLP